MIHKRAYRGALQGEPNPIFGKDSCPKRLDWARLEKRLHKLIYGSEWSVIYESQYKVEIGEQCKGSRPLFND